MSINPASGVAPFRQVAADLRRRIKDGELAPGMRLPTTRELMAEYDVATATAVRAVDLLRSEGAVVTRRGRGTFVADAPTRVRRRSSRDRYPRARADKQRLTAGLTHTITSNGPVEAPEDIAPLFGLEPGDQLWLRRRLLRDEAGDPVEVGQSWLRIDDIDGTELAENTPTRRALFLVLEDLTGRVYTTAEDQWIARVPTDDEANALHIRPPTPLLTVRHIARDGNGQVIEVSESAWPGDRVVLTDTYDIGPGTPIPADPSDV